MPFSLIKSLVPALTAAWLVAGAAYAGEEEGAKAESPPEPKARREFNEKRGRALALAGKIEEGEKTYRALVEEEAASPDTATKRGIVREMIKVSDQNAKDAEQYRAIKSDLALRYPGEGELELPNPVAPRAGGGLDEVLTQTKKLIDQKFAPFAPPAPAGRGAGARRAPAAVGEPPERHRLRLER